MIENKNVGTLTVRKDSAQVVFNENMICQIKLE